MDLWTGVVICLCLSYPDTSLSDLHRFPPLCYCEAAVAFNREYDAWLKGQLDCRSHHEEIFRDAIAENFRAWWVWDALLYAQDESKGEQCRIQWLREVRHCIGEEAFFAGRMPPCVPVWRFSQR